MKRRPVTPEEIVAHENQSQSERCFICKIAAGDPEEVHHIVYQNDSAIVFHNRYPT